MDRTFVAQQQRTPVYQLGLELWRDNVVRNKAIAERLLAILTDLVMRERSGEMIDRSLIKSVTQVRALSGSPLAGMVLPWGQLLLFGCNVPLSPHNRLS